MLKVNTAALRNQYSLKYFRVSRACSVVRSRSPKYKLNKFSSPNSNNSPSATSPMALSTPLSTSRLSEFDKVSSIRQQLISSSFDLHEYWLCSSVMAASAEHSSRSSTPQELSPCWMNDERLIISKPASFPVLQGQEISGKKPLTLGRLPYSLKFLRNLRIPAKTPTHKTTKINSWNQKLVWWYPTSTFKTRFYAPKVFLEAK